MVTDRARCRVSMLGMILAYRTVSSFSRAVRARDDPMSNLLLVVVISTDRQTSRVQARTGHKNKRTNQ